MNGKIDWRRKLTSRKFWALLAGLATSVMAFAGADENVILQVTGVIGAVGSCVGYMLAEGIADGSGSDNGNLDQDTE